MATKWILDPTHSEVNFKVKHMMISHVKGEFKTFNAEIEAEDDTFKNVKASAKIDVSSVFTNNEDRDNHLKSADFFNAEQHPEITFSTNSMTDTVSGEITISGVTKPVELEVEFGGINKDPWGNTRAGFSFEGKIKRSDFGLTYNAALEAGGVLVGDDIKLSGEMQFIRQN